jgi:hypothetical protein
MQFVKQKLTQLWTSPIGMKTTHFWGPVANWGKKKLKTQLRNCLGSKFKTF